MTGRPWRLLRHPDASGSWNMSVDEALLVAAPEAPPTLRLYTWERPTLSLGYRQAPPAWLERAGALGIEVVRRPTGGGAVLHAGDLTYSVVIARRSADLPVDLRGSYAWLQGVLLLGLRKLGFDARPSQASAGGDRAELCFAGTTGTEIELARRKLVGSAQRRTRQGLLQHGSIRIAPDAELYHALTGYAPEGVAPGLKRPVAEVAGALVGAFAATLPAGLELGALDDREVALAQQRHRQRRHDPLAAPPLSSRRLTACADRLP